MTLTPKERRLILKVAEIVQMNYLSICGAITRLPELIPQAKRDQLTKKIFEFYSDRPPLRSDGYFYMFWPDAFEDIKFDVLARMEFRVMLLLWMLEVCDEANS